MVFKCVRKGAAEQSISLLFYVFQDELAQLIDDSQRIRITFPLSLAPSKQAMSAQNNSVAGLAGVNRLTQHHGKFKSRPLPRQPDQSVFEETIELLHFLAPVCRCG